MKTIPTKISQAFWCDSKSLKFMPALVAGQPVCWMDELLHGGIKFPEPTAASPRALTLLLCGPPGTGKSIFATELCYRWAKTADQSELFVGHPRFLYLTTEAYPPWLIANACSMWPEAMNYFRTATEIEIESPRKIVTVADFYDQVHHANEHHAPGVTAALRAVVAQLANCMSAGNQNSGHPPSSIPAFDVIVVDSLNVLPDERARASAFQRFFRWIRGGRPRIVVFVMDTFANDRSAKAQFFEYVCDIVIRLDRTRPITPAASYMLRTIEVVKARHQSHVWGPHPLKILERETAHDQRDKETAHQYSERLKEQNQRLKKTHPFRDEGGIFIFPSIHYQLSRCSDKYRPVGPPDYGEHPITSLRRVFRGFPLGRSTALIGWKGMHKSHLCFRYILDRVIRHREAGLVVTLRDDIPTTINNFKSYIAEWKDEEGTLRIDPTDMLDGNDIELMDFMPGNISVEEFMHRILLSIARLKTAQNGGTRKVVCLVNSLDHLEARFPECARQPLFVVGLIELLSAEGVTSLFVDASSRPAERFGEQTDDTLRDVSVHHTYHGLEAIADLVLHFHREFDIGRQGYLNAIMRAAEAEGRTPSECVTIIEDFRFTERDRALDIVRVIRSAGGHLSGNGAILKLIKQGDQLTRLLKPGLKCFPLQ